MQAIILAAGMGKRLKELTNDATKCMVKVNGITMIERMLSQLDVIGLSRVILVIGYKAEALKDFLKTLHFKTPILFVENPIYDKTNNIYSLFLARDYMKQEATLLLESDLIFDDSVLLDILNDPHPSLALVARYESWMDGTVVTLREDNSIQEFLSKEHFQFSQIKQYYKTVNIYKFSRHFAETQYIPFLEAYIQALGTNEYYEQVLKVILKLNYSEMKAKVLEKGNWYEIDDVQDLDIAESIFNPSESERFDLMQSRYGGFWRYPNVLDFCYLVNPYYPPQKLLDEIKANFEVLASTYPSGQRVINLLSAKFFEVSQRKIVTGNGAAELIKSVLEQIPGKLGVILPTFEEYPNRRKEDIIVFESANKEFSYSAKELMEFFKDKQISMLVVINPDNPSGNCIPYEDMITLVQWATSKGIWLIIDESFIDFADLDGSILQDHLLEKYPLLIVIKSISKAYGVPGFRLGILACGDENLVGKIRSYVSIWNINSYGEFYLQICEKYKKDFEEAMFRFFAVRDKFFEQLSELPLLRPIPSKANYIMCEVLCGCTARELAEFLLSNHDILIKDLSTKPGVKGEYIRVAVKTPEENLKLIMAVELFSDIITINMNDVIANDRSDISDR